MMMKIKEDINSPSGQEANNPAFDPDPKILVTLTTMRMPFGKYKGRILCDLPEFYLVWFHNKGFPPGKLGMLLGTLYEIKLNGLEYLLKPLRR